MENIEIMRIKLQVNYQLAVKYGLKYPKTWDESSKAGADGFSAYIKINPPLSIRSPEATRFNKHNVAMFIRKLDEIMKTTANNQCVIATRGTKQVGAMTSGERGQLVSLTFAVNCTIPPIFVFPCIHYEDHFV